MLLGVCELEVCYWDFFCGLIQNWVGCDFFDDGQGVDYVVFFCFLDFVWVRLV